MVWCWLRNGKLLIIQDYTFYQGLQCVLRTKYSSRWVFVRFPSVFCSFNNSKSVKLKFIEFVRLKAFFQVVHFICSLTLPPKHTTHIWNTGKRIDSTWGTTPTILISDEVRYKMNVDPLKAFILITTFRENYLCWKFLLLLINRSLKLV